MVRSISVLFAVIFVFAPEALAARVLDIYDIDSLSALATEIVKVKLGDSKDVQTDDGDCAVWEVTVITSFKGDVKPKSVIRVVGIEEYRKHPGFEGVDKGYPRLSRGDVVYLFLAPKDAPLGYAKYRLTNADWLVIESGTRLVAKDSVHSFGQYVPPPPSAGPVPGFVVRTQKTSPKAPVLSIKAFEQRVQDSVRFVGELKHKLSSNGLTEAEQLAILKSRADVLRSEVANTDHIPQLVRP